MFSRRMNAISIRHFKLLFISMGLVTMLILQLCSVYQPELKFQKAIAVEKELEPLIDRRRPTKEELINEIESRVPNLPLAYSFKRDSQKIGRFEKSEKNINQTCIPNFPSILNLKFNNIYWQILRTSSATFYLYSAYYDVRKLSDLGPASIKIIAMIDKIEPAVKTCCQLWFEDDWEPAISVPTEHKRAWNVKGFTAPDMMQPYIIGCRIPESHQKRGPPVSVSLVERTCDTASTNLRVIDKKSSSKSGFAVCVKAISFINDLSVRLIEWIELLGLLGVEKIFFYRYHVHPNISKVFDHYVKLGRIEVTPMTLPGGQPNIPGFDNMYAEKKRGQGYLNEITALNDCLYQHMYQYEYIAIFDIDEVIIPARDSTWPELIKRVKPKAVALYKEAPASYAVQNNYFLDGFHHEYENSQEIPKYMHMLQHVKRTEKIPGMGAWMKCFHDPERISAIHNHLPFFCFGSECRVYWIDGKDAKLQHYRSDCIYEIPKKECDQLKKNLVNDTTIWRYKDPLIQRVTDALQILKFLPPDNTLG